MAAAPWTDAEHATLKAMIATHGFAEIGQALGRTRRACETRAHEMGLRRNLRRPWSAEDIAALRRLFPEMSNADCAAALGRSETAVKERAVVERLRKSDAYVATLSGRRREMALARGAGAKRTAGYVQGRGTLMGRPWRTPRFLAPGDYTPTQDAVAHLRRIGPIWRCTADGATDPKGDHWKFSGRVMDAAAIEARAERAGWVRPVTAPAARASA